jgi:hypothetical protein
VTLISKEEFRAIAEDVAASAWKIEVVSITDYRVDIGVRSNSGKGSYEGWVDFDPQTGHFTWGANPYYPGANGPLRFGDQVQARLMELFGRS